MLRNLRIFFYNNKVKIIRNVLIVALIILVIQGMNYLVGKNAGIDNKISINNQFTYGNLIDFGNTVNKNNTISGSNETQNPNGVISNNNTIGGNSIVGGNNITSGNVVGGDSTNASNENTVSESEKVIISFLDLCIQGNINKAYELISEECKNVLFPTIERFQKNYYSKIFNTNKVYTVEEYYGSTYKVKIAENMNITGAYTALANTEYITPDFTDEGIKLNINNYIGRYNIGKSSTQNNITVKVNYKDVFMDYERYNITVNNESSKIIMLNGDNSNNTMYVSNHNGNKFYAYTNEISRNSLILRSGSTQDFNIKYNCSYSEYTGSKNMLVFSNIILDYDSYKNFENISEYKGTGMINVEI